jgi:hypothetical protein
VKDPGASFTLPAAPHVLVVKEPGVSFITPAAPHALLEKEPCVSVTPTTNDIAHWYPT